MTSKGFCYWLQGYAELSAPPPTESQWTTIRKHLDMVFEHELDKEIPDQEGKLQTIHGGTVLRC